MVRVVIGGLLAMGACEAPRVVVVSEPSDVGVYRDGARIAARTPLNFEAPYYGTLLIELDAADPDRRLVPQQATVAVEPALPGWLFGLDLLAELWTHALGRSEVRLERSLPAIPKAELGDERVGERTAAAQAAGIAR